MHDKLDLLLFSPTNKMKVTVFRILTWNLKNSDFAGELIKPNSKHHNSSIGAGMVSDTTHHFLTFILSSKMLNLAQNSSN